ncbi:unnamed protein product [Gordionus sp. m RMFG-2023]
MQTSSILPDIDFEVCEKISFYINEMGCKKLWYTAIHFIDRTHRSFIKVFQANLDTDPSKNQLIEVLNLPLLKLSDEKKVGEIALNSSHLFIFYTDKNLEIVKISPHSTKDETIIVADNSLILKGVTCFGISNESLFYANQKNQILFHDLSYHCDIISQQSLQNDGAHLLSHHFSIKRLTVHPNMCILVFVDSAGNHFFYDLEKDHLSSIDVQISNETNELHTKDLENIGYLDQTHIIWDLSLHESFYPFPVFLVLNNQPPSNYELLVYVYMSKTIHGPLLNMINRILLNNFLTFKHLSKHPQSNISENPFTVITAFLSLGTLSFWSLYSQEIKSEKTLEDNLNMIDSLPVPELNIEEILLSSENINIPKNNNVKIDSLNQNDNNNIIKRFLNALDIGHLQLAWKRLHLLRENHIKIYAEIFLIKALRLMRIDWAKHACKHFGQLLTHQALSMIAMSEDRETASRFIKCLFQDSGKDLDLFSLCQEISNNNSIVQFSNPVKDILNLPNETDHPNDTDPELRHMLNEMEKNKGVPSLRESRIKDLGQKLVSLEIRDRREAITKIKSYLEFSKVIALKTFNSIDHNSSGDSFVSTEIDRERAMNEEINDLITYHYMRKVFEIIDENGIDIEKDMEAFDLNMNHLPHFYFKIADYFNQKGSHLLAGDYYLKANLLEQALKNYLTCAKSITEDCRISSPKDTSDYDKAITGLLTTITRLYTPDDAYSNRDIENKTESFPFDHFTETKREHALNEVVTFLLRPNNYEKDLKTLLNLYIYCGKISESNKIALIICDMEKENGLFEDAHRILYQTYKSLILNMNKNEAQQNKVIISDHLDLQLMLLHSYKIAKIQMKSKMNDLSAKLLMRLIFEFPSQFFFSSPSIKSEGVKNLNQHALFNLNDTLSDINQISDNFENILSVARIKIYHSVLISAALQCWKAGLEAAAYKIAVLIFEKVNEHKKNQGRPEFIMSQPNKIKLQNIIRKYKEVSRHHSPEKSDSLNLYQLVPCKFCGTDFENYKIVCSKCGEINCHPYCILTGLRLNKTVLSEIENTEGGSRDDKMVSEMIGCCPSCNFPYLKSAAKEFS